SLRDGASGSRNGSEDNTERKGAEEALRKSEDRWRSVFENSAIGAALTDIKVRFLEANPVYQKMLGYTEKELRTLSFLDVTHEAYRESNWALVAELLEGKTAIISDREAIPAQRWQPDLGEEQRFLRSRY